MYNKRQDVLLPESASEDIVHVLCPALDFRTSLDRAVVDTFLVIDFLVAKRQLAQTVVRAADDEVHDGPVFRIVGPFLVGILDPSRGDVLQVFLRDGFALVHLLHLSSLRDLEVQAGPGAVDAAVLVRLRPAPFGPAALVLVALGRRESLLRLEVHHLFLCFHFALFLVFLQSLFSGAQLAGMLALLHLARGQVGIVLPTSL